MTDLLALAASLLWGTSDFIGGTVSRRLDPIAVVTWADALVLPVLLVIAVATGQLHVDAGLAGWGCGAGLVGLVGVTGFYRALADGAMGVVAPIAGLGVAVPVVTGVALGNHPDGTQIIGIALAVLAVLLVSSATDGQRTSGRVLGLAALAGVSFGTCFVFIDRSEPHGTLMTLVMMRVAVLGAVGIGAALTRRRPRVDRRSLPLVAASGGLDVLANASFAAATGLGQLAVVSVLSSLYPAVTAMLAWAVHDERLGRRQLLGVGGALAAIVLLAAGPSA